MILDHTRSRRALTRRALLTMLGIGAAALLPLAMLRPTARAQAAASSPKRSVLVPKRSIGRATARVSAVSAVPGEYDANQLVGEGRALSSQAAAGLEQRLALHPDDYAAHIQLLGYYGGHQFEGGAAKSSYAQQVFWFIRNHPESVLAGTPYTTLIKRDDGEAFEQGKALWLEQVARNPASTAILSKAADYCVLSDEGTAERLLRQAAAREPRSPVWPDKLGHLYQLHGDGPMAPPDDSRLWAQKALAEYESAAALSANKTLQHSTSSDLAKTAFDAGQYDKALRYATDLLQRGRNKEGHSWDPSGDVHYANLILGLLALHDGDTAQAETHLLAMGQISGSPALDTFGPNMRLAKELLALGKRDTVLAYFEECAKFWTYDSEKTLKTWQAQVRQGKTPDFRANLYY